MADIWRGPTFQQRREKPPLSAPQVAVNLLTTTLSAAVVTIALPLGAGRSDGLQLQHPGHIKYLNDDTSLGTPKALTADAQLPFQTLQHRAPDRPRPVADTSQDSPLALLSIQPPFVPVLHQAPAWPKRIFSETAENSPKALYGDAVAPLVNSPFSLPQRPRLASETSQDAYATQYAPAVVPPFFGSSFAQAHKPSLVSDSSFTVLYNVEIPPVVPPDHQAPVKTKWLPTETSDGTPKPLFGDAVVPLVNLPYPTPDRVRPVVDTTQKSPLALIVPVDQPLPPARQTYWPAPIEYKYGTHHTWDAQANPDTIPAAVVVPDVSTQTPAGKSRKRKKYEVEIDGEVFDVESAEEAAELLVQARQVAEDAAKLALDRANNTKKRPIRKILADARKTLKTPEIRTDAPIGDAVKNALNEIAALYRDTLQTIEIGALMRRREEEDDEEVLLLASL